MKLVYRHNRVTRFTHWIDAIALMVLFMSGLQIFNAFPQLYWGSKAELNQAFLSNSAKEHDGDVRGYTEILGHRRHFVPRVDKQSISDHVFFSTIARVKLPHPRISWFSHFFDCPSSDLSWHICCLVTYASGRSWFRIDVLSRGRRAMYLTRSILAVLFFFSSLGAVKAVFASEGSSSVVMKTETSPALQSSQASNVLGQIAIALAGGSEAMRVATCL